MQQRRRILLMLGVMIIAAFFRFWQITETPPGLYPDEAMNGTNAQEAIRTGDYKIFYPENNGREGMFMNIQSLSLRAFGNEPWALRIVSAIFGLLTVLGIYFLTRELFQNSETTALLSAFFLATSYWHINFSRIGFRAITVPFLLVWAFYFLYRMIRALREGGDKSNLPELFALLGGVFFGAGFHTYIAYRVSPLLLLPPFLRGFVLYRKNLLKKCFPCTFILFLFAAFITALPIGYYFLQNPQDFLGRTSQVSVFASENPLWDLVRNTGLTIGMFFWHGDFNWRHNLSGEPQLWWPVGVFFIIGLVVIIKRIFTANEWGGSNIVTRFIKNLFLTSEGFLLIWLKLLAIPVVITNEGLPHALRAIGMIPPIMIITALGCAWVFKAIKSFVIRNKERYPSHEGQVVRIGRELSIFMVIILILVAHNTFSSYFLLWASNPNTHDAFTSTYTDIGRHLRTLPDEASKYVIVNAGGVDVRGLPMPAQPVMFMMGEGIASRNVPTPKHVTYILPEDVERIVLSPNGPTYIAMLDSDGPFRKMLMERFPNINFEPIVGSTFIGIIEQ